MTEYSKLLRNPYWQRKRNAILERDKYTCQKCTDTLTNLQVHHKYYIDGKMPWEYPDDALVTVCELCHKKEEFIKWILRNIEYHLFEDRFSTEDIASVREIIIRRVTENKHAESAERYMSDLKVLICG